MKIPLIVYLQFWVLVLPVVAAAIKRRELDGARRAIALWYLVTLLGSAVSYAWTRLIDNTNNLVVSYFFSPIMGTAVLWAVGELQTRPLARTAVRISIPLIFVAWVLGYFFIEDQQNYSIFGAPILGIVVLCSALLALLSRLHDDAEAALTSDWLWFLTGITIYFAANTAVSILQAIYTQQEDMASLVRTTKVQAAIEIFATLIVTGGFLWPNQRLHPSGSSSSPAPSR